MAYLHSPVSTDQSNLGSQKSALCITCHQIWPLLMKGQLHLWKRKLNIMWSKVETDRLDNRSEGDVGDSKG